MLNKYKMLIISCSILFLLLVGTYIIKFILDQNNIERITYNGRIYIKSKIATMDADLKKIFDETQPTGIIVKGMEVYDLKNRQHTSTIIFLKTKSGKIITYSLIGGP